jgi:hypothetical protein
MQAMEAGTHNLSIRAARAEALFVSKLQRSDQPSAEQIRHAVIAAVSALGSQGCAERVAQEFGDHPEAAVARMRWALACGDVTEASRRSHKDSRGIRGQLKGNR